jgi:hypothetical protein
MFNKISSFFNKNPPSSVDDNKNIYYDTFMDILVKRRDKLLSVYNIISTYSTNSKKKIDDMLSEKDYISQAIDSLRQNENIVTYYFCKDDKLYYLFEYSLTPTILKNNISPDDININENIDGFFSTYITVDAIKDILSEPKKYINFNPKKITIGGNNILAQLVIFNEEKILTDLIEKYKIHITDNNMGCGIKHHDLLDLAIKTNNGNIVHILDKCYYEPKIEKLEKTVSEDDNQQENKYKKYYNYVVQFSPIVNYILLPILLYTSINSQQCSL